jgi:trimethylamine:corrinoid methyltransferase-like protein
MNPLEQDQVRALERAAVDVDRLMGVRALERQRSDVADWSIWEAVVIQGVPVRRAASMLHLGRQQVRSALRRVRRQLNSVGLDTEPEQNLQLYPPGSWSETATG